MKKYFFALCALLTYTSCYQLKTLIYGNDDLNEHIDSEHYKLWDKYAEMREIVPSSYGVRTSYRRHINPPLDTTTGRGYWSTRFYYYKHFEVFEFSENDTIQEGYYFVKEQNTMYHYKSDWHYKPNRLSIKILPYDTAHYALKIMHKNQSDLLKPNYKYLITIVDRVKRDKWNIKSYGYYNGKKYE
jgi:hypothetical protein